MRQPILKTLRLRAEAQREQARATMAAALALEDGELKPDEAYDFSRLDGELERIQSDLYPGDEYFDRADRELQL